MVDINTYSQNPTFSSEIEWNFQLNKALKVANLQDLEVVNIKEQDNKKKKKIEQERARFQYKKILETQP